MGPAHHIRLYVVSAGVDGMLIALQRLFWKVAWRPPVMPRLSFPRTFASRRDVYAALMTVTSTRGETKRFSTTTNTNKTLPALYA